MPPQIKQKAKVLCITSGRSDIYIWKPVWDELRKIQTIELFVARTGMHFAKGYSSHIKEFRDFNIIDVKHDLGAASPSKASQAMGKITADFSKIFTKFNFDVLFVLGDRMDMIPAVIASLPFKMKVLHLHGGEISEGAIDDKVRHAVSMMSSVHFVAHKMAKQKLLSFGIKNNFIHVVGAPGIDNIAKIRKIKKSELLRDLRLPVDISFFLCTIHPETNSSEPERTFMQTMEAIKDFKENHFIFTHSNSDPCKISINKALEQKSKNYKNVIFLPKLDYESYINLMRHCKAVIGNSSSGIIEAPFLSKKSLNIGDRQKGRVADISVMHCKNEKLEIIKHLKRLSSENPKVGSSKLYGNAHAAIKIGKIIRKMYPQ